MLSFRKMDENDYDFLMDMQYESIHILENKPPKLELLNAPHLKKYHEGWGRQGDMALLALMNNVPVGAGWYRLFDESNRGYGFVDHETPELGIAVLPAYRGQGVGFKLMQELIKQAQKDGFPSLSLSVDPNNLAAVRMYEKLEFVFCGVVGTSWTMKLV
ncbi:GNAT family N-acetyltransferase [Paenibacillus sp. CGMCC 1.16610]|uniref:GNAT family N-acetyltransferase n=1 Tax=Paenibacillus anseongense TaxID=2682845 RepID=A0ABW9UMM0_9BACL|nr:MULTISPECIES: GNAT family N-acetyltransferase [Paenibacillus]MBA2941432.1 GNAT family N-acetyltransferase [Paenibacillus sp. CGMCC 1.16610]MVQ40251.1 GNAT family N-acetyltransferase [Paenibacillus anseongense]